MEQEQVQVRKERGYLIAKTARIERTEKGWKVPSQSGSGYYTVISNGFGAECTCPDHETRHCKCKHIWAVELIVTKEVDNDGNVTITKTVRKTYAQDWKNYNLAQQNEKALFMKLLADITNGIGQPTYSYGRPQAQLGDMVYSMVYKVYSGFSGRRFTTDMNQAKEAGHIETTAHFNSLLNYFRKPEMTELLSQIVTLTSLPLRSVEKDFAVDSTGFGTTHFQRWFSFKHGREICSRKWVKCHFMTGVKTNIIPSVKITTEYCNDSPEFEGLVNKAAENFDMDEVSADKAYLSRKNVAVVNELGATPYIPIKTNASAKQKGCPAWKKMFYLFQLNNDEFMEHYHKRSNVETTVHMIKSKFGDMVRSKEWTSQVNEVLCKVIAHNLCVVIQEMHELGIKPEFCTKSAEPAQIVEV